MIEFDHRDDILAEIGGYAEAMAQTAIGVGVVYYFTDNAELGAAFWLFAAGAVALGGFWTGGKLMRAHLNRRRQRQAR